MLNYKTYNTNQKEWLVLIHGINGDISVWDNHINDLKKEYNLLLIDFPFHGNSHIYAIQTTRNCLMKRL